MFGNYPYVFCGHLISPFHILSFPEVIGSFLYFMKIPNMCTATANQFFVFALPENTYSFSFFYFHPISQIYNK